MKRKLLIEESDGPGRITGQRIDAFSEGVREGLDKGSKFFIIFLIFFITAAWYMLSVILA